LALPGQEATEGKLMSSMTLPVLAILNDIRAGLPPLASWEVWPAKRPSRGFAAEAPAGAASAAARAIVHARRARSTASKIGERAAASGAPHRSWE